jgi:very-short-patch-repair endonuclease
MSGKAVLFPDEQRRRFLDLFESRDRSTVANLFYEAVRDGAATTAEVLATASVRTNERVRETEKYDDAWVRRRRVFFSHRLEAEQFAAYALDRERGLVPKHVAEPEHDSHLEDFFAATWADYLATTSHASLPLELTAAHRVGVYRIDFTLVALRIAVELDGHDYHKTREQRAHDARKARFLTMVGWLVFRFTGDEVHADPQGCAAELYRLAVRRGAFDLPYEPIAKERA